MRAWIIIFAGLGLSVACSNAAKKSAPDQAQVPANTQPQAVAQAQTQPKTENSATNTTYSCSRDAETRVITLMKSALDPVPADKRKCQVVYRKDNNTDIVAYALHQENYCDEVYERIKNHLEEAGFKCEKKSKT